MKTATKILGAVAGIAYAENKSHKQYDTVVVTFRTGKQKYAYINPGFDIKKGDVILVPTESGNDLEATVVMRTNARRWSSLATKEVIG